MTEQTLLVAVDIRSYWHAGTGRGGGGSIDAVIDRDENGLPVLRGRQLKGLIREAGERLVDWEADGWDKARVNLLFGREALQAKNGKPAQASTPGCVRFGDARLPNHFIARLHEECKECQEEEIKKLANEFVHRLASTKIQFETGAAADETLRSMEVAVPLTLYAPLTWDPAERLAIQAYDDEKHEQSEIDEKLGGKLEGEWHTAIEECLPYVLAVGAYRSRGFGRANLRVVKESK